MKIIRQVDWTYTLFEDDDGSYIFDLVIPAATGAWANYEKRVVLPSYEKLLIRAFPGRSDYLANILINKEKQEQTGK